MRPEVSAGPIERSSRPARVSAFRPGLASSFFFSAWLAGWASAFFPALAGVVGGAAAWASTGTGSSASESRMASGRFTGTSREMNDWRAAAREL